MSGRGKLTLLAIILREFVVTTASLHDSQVDLSMPGMPCYRDKGYAGAPCRGINATMDKASRNHPLTIVKKEPIMNALRIIANKVSFPLPDMAPRGK